MSKPPTPSKASIAEALPSDSSIIVETVRLNRAARDQLTTLKRRTGIENWNVLCRWALCVSLAEPTRPRDVKLDGDGAVEMAWRTFTGGDDLTYAALIRQRCLNDGLSLSSQSLAQQLKLHLHRGIAYLVGSPKLRNISSMLALALDNCALDTE